MASTTGNPIDLAAPYIRLLTTKPFIASDWSDWNFFDKKGKIVDASCPTNKQTIVKATFRIQKNRRKRQSVTIVADDTYPKICPVKAAPIIVVRARKLRPGTSCSLLETPKSEKYLTGSKIAEILQATALLVKWAVILFAFGKSLGPSPTGRGRKCHQIHSIPIALVGSLL